MPTIEQTYINALLADATYVDPLVENAPADRLTLALSSRMTPTLAKFIGDNFEVASHVESDDVLASGFDATVWRGRADTPYAGKVYVSMQGTAGLQDFLTDAELAITGDAGQQMIDMANWWLEITTPVGQMAHQIGHTVDAATGFITPAADVPGTGRVTAAELANGIEVNGHSLGGYLAAGFTRLFGAQAHVLHTTTLNSAGFALGSESAFAALTRAIGPGYGRDGFPAAGDPSQTNAFALHGLNLTTNTWWFNQVGQRIELFNEESASQIPNHYMYKLTDALALANALSLLDPTLTLERATVLFEAGSADVPASLERVLDGLLRVFVNPAAGPLAAGDVSSSDDTRVTLHNTLQQLQDEALFRSMVGNVRIEATHDGQAARDDFAALLSLTNGATFSLRLLDPSPGSPASLALYAVNRSSYEQWLADRNLTPEQRDAGAANFSDAYLPDRADMLNTLAQANTRDQNFVNVGGGGESVIYQDLLSNSSVLGQAGAGTRLVTFGGSSAEQIDGGGMNDRLYGGGGSDNLTGQGDADYLEGNAGDDVLDGGAGNDTLLGGKGADTYHFTTGFGRDVLIDADGSGRLQWNGADLPQGLKVFDGLWQSADRQVTYTLVRNEPGANGALRHDLVISFAGGSERIVIRGWNETDRNLGIAFGSNFALPETTNNLIGDFIKKELLDANGNPTGVDAFSVAANDNVWRAAA